MYFYNYNDDAVYVPLHLNLVFLSQELSFHITHLSDAFLKSLYSEIKGSSKKFFILDFHNIKMIYPRALEIFKSFCSELDKHVIFYNVDDNLLSNVAADLGLSGPDINKKAISNRDGTDFFDLYVNISPGADETLKKYKQNLIGSFLMSHIIKDDILLDSSNVIANMYFNAKAIFSAPSFFYLVLHEMADKLRDMLKGFDSFICVSNNGAAISAALSGLLNKEVTYFMNLGPHATLMSADLAKQIIPGKRYFYVYDFYCLGSEYRLLKTTLSLLNARVVGALGISKHLDRNPGSSTIDCLFRINEDVDYDYKLKIYEKEE